MADEFTECSTALKTAQNLISNSEEDVRVKFCHGKRGFLIFSPCLLHAINIPTFRFCTALMSEKRKDYTIAMEGYVTCLNQCAAAQTQTSDEATSSSANEASNPTNSSSNANSNQWTAEGTSSNAPAASTAATETPAQSKLVFMKELRGEVMLRIAVLKKEMGAIDQAMQMCNTISGEPFGDSIRANALCLKVRFAFYCCFSMEGFLLIVSTLS